MMMTNENENGGTHFVVTSIHVPARFIHAYSIDVVYYWLLVRIYE